MLRYDLPSFALYLKVTKKDNALIEFQDHLEETIAEHLQTFYENKISLVKPPTSVHVALDSKLVWKELSSTTEKDTSSSTTITEYTAQTETTFKQYEVSGKYECKIAIKYDMEEMNEQDSKFLTQSLMNLFFIESFQADNYWDLLHSFLSSPILQDIKDVQITVLEDGFIPYSGGQPSFDDDYYIPLHTKTNSGSGMTPGMILGVALATIFCIGLVGIWIYLCFMVPGTFFYDLRKNGGKVEGLYKESDSVTDDACTNSSVDMTPDDEESKWLDHWAQSITSIPLREPKSVFTEEETSWTTNQAVICETSTSTFNILRLYR